MRQIDVAVLVLQHIRAGSLQHARAAAGESCRVTAPHDGLASRLDTNQPNGRIVYKRVKNTHRVAATAHAGDNGIRQTTSELLDLRAGFAADHRLEFSHHE